MINDLLRWWVRQLADLAPATLRASADGADMLVAEMAADWNAASGPAAKLNFIQRRNGRDNLLGQYAPGSEALAGLLAALHRRGQPTLLRLRVPSHLLLEREVVLPLAAERGILCAECDGILGRYENSAFQLIKRLRSVRVGGKLGTESFVNEGTYPFRVAVVDEFVRFACGILWKYSSTPADEQSHIEIGECRALFEGICWHGAPIPEGVDVFIERDLFSFAAFTDPSQVYYYCSPSIGLRGYVTSHDFAWFSVGGFTIYVKLNQPGLSDFAPRKCWMRGRKACHFNVAMRSIEVNSSIHKSVGITRDDLARLNKGIYAKYQSGQLP